MKKTFTILCLLFLTVALRGYSQISTFPYVQTGDIPTGWSVIQSTPLWSLAPAAINPAGVANDAAIVCNFFSYASGPSGLVLSPAFNFTSLTSPVVNFYSAYRSYSTENDSLQFLISTDNGVTFGNVPTAFRRSYNSTPSLATGPSQITAFTPTSVNDWRHETIDLSAYAGLNNIVFAFRGVCDYGNNLWIDNFIVTNKDGYCQTNVSSAGSYSCGDAVVVFNTVGLRPLSKTENQNDNPGGGVLSVTRHDNQAPPSLASPVVQTNLTATNPGNSIITPNVIYQDYWYTVSYTGNDRFGYANYDLKIDVSNFSDISTLYIMKRADMTASWVCQNTTFAGNYLIASGLTTFSDFVIGGDSSSQPLPVELSSFTSALNGRNVTLNWTTASESNNAGFDLERRDANGLTAGDWTKIGNVTGNGTATGANSYSFTDRNIATGKYNYRLKQIDFNGNFEYFSLNNEVVIGTPERFSLSQNYPNPFNPSTNINYDLPFDSKVSIKIFDMSGREVASVVNEFKTAGFYTVNFNASALSSGVYFYIINADNFTATKKMILVK
ncbi:MAG: T9SS type A sorting domain-containing protein [Ignavibacteria bacterium]|nr:T9SS type A sorting domain-containing protein [Ignavibacteria bacterium]MBK9405446.1 T9SS type A sorting domain-containing protein [Ignavibacteria bacterium]